MTIQNSLSLLSILIIQEISVGMDDHSIILLAKYEQLNLKTEHNIIHECIVAVE